MAHSKSPWLPEGVILFSRGDLSYEYELLRELETSHHDCIPLPSDLITTDSGRG